MICTGLQFTNTFIVHLFTHKKLQIVKQ